MACKNASLLVRIQGWQNHHDCFCLRQLRGRLSSKNLTVYFLSLVLSALPENCPPGHQALELVTRRRRPCEDSRLWGEQPVWGQRCFAVQHCWHSCVYGTRDPLWHPEELQWKSESALHSYIKKIEVLLYLCKSVSVPGFKLLWLQQLQAWALKSRFWKREPLSQDEFSDLRRPVNPRNKLSLSVFSPCVLAGTNNQGASNAAKKNRPITRVKKWNEAIGFTCLVLIW